MEELAPLLRLEPPSVSARMALLLKQVDLAYQSGGEGAAGGSSEQALFTRVHALLSDPHSDFDEAWRAAAEDMVRSCAAELVIAMPERVYHDLDSAVDSFKALYCRRCHIFDCQLHGCGQLLPAGRGAWAAATVDPDMPLLECGPSCALGHGDAGLDREQAEWSAMELSFLATACKIHGRNSCRIARILNSRTCLEVRAAPCMRVCTAVLCL